MMMAQGRGIGVGAQGRQSSLRRWSDEHLPSISGHLHFRAAGLYGYSEVKYLKLDLDHERVSGWAGAHNAGGGIAFVVAL